MSGTIQHHQPLAVSLVRHGRTSGNERGAFVGSTDQPLVAAGREELLAIAASGRRPAVQAVYLSPMLRCVQTAEILYPSADCIVVDDLRERHFGDFEDLTHQQITALPGFGGWGMSEGLMNFPGGETWEPFQTRCVAAFGSVAEMAQAAGHSRIAVVCHGGVIMALMAACCTQKRAYHAWMCANGCGYQVEWDPAAHAITLQEELER